MVEQRFTDEAGRVLIVEDDGPTAHLLKALLEDVGVRTEIARTGQQALASVERRPPDLVLLDLQLPGLHGTSLAVILRITRPGLPVIVVSALPAADVAKEARNIGALNYFSKPFDAVALVERVQQVLSTPRSVLIRALPGSDRVA